MSSKEDEIRKPRPLLAGPRERLEDDRLAIEGSPAFEGMARVAREDPEQVGEPVQIR